MPSIALGLEDNRPHIYETELELGRQMARAYKQTIVY